MFGIKKNNLQNGIQPTQKGRALIELNNLHKVYRTDAGEFPALKGIDLRINAGEFVSVIGKSGSGKTTLINMLTGIDRPTEGEIVVGGVSLRDLSEGEMARWRGTHMGVVFQFFQLLPTLSVLQNVMLPMDFCNVYDPSERRDRAMHLLELVDIADHADKPPSRLSGGQQQRAAIARALANDPPIIATDEPTGNLDSRTANQIFDLFERLVDGGKTILMVTHDDDLAERAARTVIISDGEIVNEYLAKAMPTLSHEVMMKATRRLDSQSFAPGEVIIQQGASADRFYIITGGQANVYLTRPDAHAVIVDRLRAGQYFGEMGLFQGDIRRVQVRSSAEYPVNAISLDKSAFSALLDESEEMRVEIAQSVTSRTKNLTAAAGM